MNSRKMKSISEHYLQQERVDRKRGNKNANKLFILGKMFFSCTASKDRE